MNKWRYSIMRSESKGEISYSIHELYRIKEDLGWTVEPASVCGEDTEQLRKTLELMLKCLDEPVLDYSTGKPIDDENEKLSDSEGSVNSFERIKKYSDKYEQIDELLRKLAIRMSIYYYGPEDFIESLQNEISRLKNECDMWKMQVSSLNEKIMQLENDQQK